MNRSATRAVRLVSAMVGVGLGINASHATIAGPYTVDANTLHLWHLDESGTPAADQAHYSYTSGFTPTKDANQPLAALFGTGVNGTATLGNAGFTGYGTALSTQPATLLTTGSYPANSIQPGMGALTPANGTTDNVDHTFDNPTTHAFTMEALVKIGFDATGTYAAPQEIISGEGDASDSSDRSWQFRIEAKTVAANPWVLRFQKLSGFANPDTTIPAGSSQANFNLDASIPSTGVNAITTAGWYQVAVTFNGDLNDASNLKLYWTKMDGSNTTANLIGSGKMNGYLREQDTDFGLGNELRDFNGNTEPFAGQIDEVRISDIARSANAFAFVPEPVSLAGLAVGMSLLGRRRKA